MSLATTQMLSQHLATITARIGALQSQVSDLTSASGSKPAEPSAKSEVELVERVEAAVTKNVRIALAGDIRDAMVRERQVVEDKIIQSVSLVSEDVQTQVQGQSDSVKALSDTFKVLSDSVKALSESSAAASASIKALEDTLKVLSETSKALASDVAGLTKRVEDLEVEEVAP
jgi:chromosome segregation ATPase